METILRSEAVALINTGEPCNLEYVTADRRRGTGGKLIRLENWVKVMQANQQAPVATTGGIPSTASGSSRNPSHLDHGTINMKNPGNKQIHIHKVHTALMLTFNNKRIING